ncbi:MAG: VanZ family protein [Clostridiales bacterium]|nr:VanZ family protein [Candidatus Equinaster intestinalis]
MKRKLFFRYFCLIFSIAIMLLIFLMSAQNSNSSSGASGRFVAFFANVFVKGFREGSDEFRNSIIISAQFFVRKFAHFSLFGSLAFFLCGFFSTVFDKYLKNLLFSLASSLLYAGTDEFHQVFVPGRSGEIRDILIDFSGAVIGTAIMLLIVYLFRRPKYEIRRKHKQKG